MRVETDLVLCAPYLLRYRKMDKVQNSKFLVSGGKGILRPSTDSGYRLIVSSDRMNRELGIIWKEAALTQTIVDERFFALFLSASMLLSTYYLEARHHRFLPHPSRFIIN
jgi:hypothetical protein